VSRLLDAADSTAREAAWKAFIETHSRLLLHTARKLGRDYDATMDAYAYLVEQLRRDDFQRLRAYVSDERTKFTTWLVVVARRLCLDHLRERYGRPAEGSAKGRDARRVRRQLVDLLAEELDASALTAHATADNPETQLRADELGRALTAALGGLEARDRLLLKLRFEDGLPAREIGQIMGFATPFHVYRRLNTLLGRLQKALRQQGIEGPEP
jgi:RNA polymerase sigma factor (sigma-70 family)